MNVLDVNKVLLKRCYQIGAGWRIYALFNYFNIGSDNGLSPCRRQAII